MNAKFEKWCESQGRSTYVYADGEYCRETSSALRTWQAAIQSLEVTPELVEIGFEATHERSQTTRRDIEKALTAVFNAIKEQAK